MINRLICWFCSFAVTIISSASYGQSNSDSQIKKPSNSRYILIKSETLLEETGLNKDDLIRSNVKFDELSEKEVLEIQRQINDTIRPQTNERG